MISIQRRIICFILTSDLEKSAKNARCHSSSAAPFSKLLLNRVESRKVFNMLKLRLIHSFSTVYYTPHFDKRLKIRAKIVPEKITVAVFSDEKFTRVSSAAQLVQRMALTCIQRAVWKWCAE